MIHLIQKKWLVFHFFLVSNLLSFFSIISLIIVSGFISTSLLASNNPAEKIFQDHCAACHTIGGGPLVGPDLQGVHDRRSQQWLKTFVSSSQTMISNGDEQAIALFKQYNNMPMPDPAISAQQIDEVLRYIKSAKEITSNISGTRDIEETKETEAASSTKQSAISRQIVEEEIVTGQNIFQGVERLKNGGPACNACHDVINDSVIGGGILARELTSVFSRMGGPAVRSILGSAPFPVMKRAYLDKPLTKSEISALVAFFQQTDQERAYQRPRDYGIGLFISGVIGAGFLLIFYSLLWSRRKKNSVNQSIYDRQIKSS